MTKVWLRIPFDLRPLVTFLMVRCTWLLIFIAERSCVFYVFDCRQEASLELCVIMKYMAPSISFQTFFVQAFRIVVDSWKFSMLLLYIIWDD